MKNKPKLISSKKLYYFCLAVFCLIMMFGFFSSVQNLQAATTNVTSVNIMCGATVCGKHWTVGVSLVCTVSGGETNWNPSPAGCSSGVCCSDSGSATLPNTGSDSVFVSNFSGNTAPGVCGVGDDAEAISDQGVIFGVPFYCIDNTCNINAPVVNYKNNTAAQFTTQIQDSSCLGTGGAFGAAAGGAYYITDCSSGYTASGDNVCTATATCAINSFTADNSTPSYNTGTTLRFSLSGSFPWTITSTGPSTTPYYGTGSSGTASTGSLTLPLINIYTLTCGSASQNLTVVVGRPSNPQCSPSSQTINVGNPASFTGTIYDGSNTYAWTATGGSPSSGTGSSFSSTYNTSSSGSPYSTYLTDSLGDQSNTCFVTVNGLTAPTGLTVANSCGVNSLTVSWTAVSGATIYRAYRDGGPSPIYTGASTSFTDNSGLLSGSTHSYTVSASNALGSSPQSPPISNIVSSCVKPATPTGLAANYYGGTTPCGTLYITWNAVSNATSYTIYRDGFPVYVGPYVSYFTDSGLTAGSHTYNIIASNSQGDSPTSGPTSGTNPLYCTPSPPTGLTGTTGGSCGTINLSWNSVSGAVYYDVYRDNGSSPVYTGASTNFTDSGLTGGLHSYTVDDSPDGTHVSYESPSISAGASGCPPSMVNGSCGSSSGGSFYTAPTTNLCSAGTPTLTPSGSGPWSWGCNGSSGGTNTSSNACGASQEVNGSCGSASGSSFSSLLATSSNLCANSTPVNDFSGPGFGPWTWGCYGLNGGTNTASNACSALTTNKINGACGPANGGTFPSLYSCSSVLCAISTTVASFSGSGPWTWGCNGLNGGTNTASNACSATKATPPNAPVVTGPSTGNTGTLYTFSATATDAGNSQIRYGFDWNNDGTADTWMPADGSYVNSGTAQSASYSWTTSGTPKTFQVLAQDTAGLNSSWGSGSITISNYPTITSFTVAPTSVSPGGSVTLTWTSLHDNSCSISGGWTGSGLPASSSQPVNNLNSSTSFTLVCQDVQLHQSSPQTVSVVVNTPSLVTVNKTIGGSVTSTDGNINCGTTCSYSYSSGANVTLTATPDSSGWKFVGWIGDCSGSGSCSLTVSAPKSVTALFIPMPSTYQEF